MKLDVQFSLTAGTGTSKIPEIDIYTLSCMIKEGKFGKKVVVEFERMDSCLQATVKADDAQADILRIPCRKSESDQQEELKAKLSLPLSSIGLPIRLYNILRNGNVHTVLDLVVRGKQKILGFRNFGPVCLHQTEKVLAGLGLRLDMREELNQLGVL